MADVHFPIIEGEPTWAFARDPLDLFHFQDSMDAAGYHIGEAGDYVPTYRGEPATINLYALGPAYNDPLRANQPGTLNAPSSAVVTTPIAPVVTPISPGSQVNGVIANTSAPTSNSTWLVLGIAALVVIAISA